MNHKEIQNEVVKQLGEAYHNKDFLFDKMERQFGDPISLKPFKIEWLGYLESQGLTNS